MCNWDVDEGDVVDYILVLVCVDGGLFGFCVVEVDGAFYDVGDSEYVFSI